MTLQEHAKFYFDNIRPTGTVIDFQTVLSQAIRAAKYYEGFGVFQLKAERESTIDENLELLNSEWAMIAPLFELYTERENALILEATRSLGIETYGRSVSEISSEITQKEQEIQSLAFQYDIVTI